MLSNDPAHVYIRSWPVSRQGDTHRLTPLQIHTYPDGVPLVRKLPYVDTHENLSLLLRPRGMTDFIAGLFWVDAYRERHSLGSVKLVLPFVPGARQDRLNNQGDYLFTAKSVAHMINARAFSSVVILDPHSEVISGLIDRCKVVHSHELGIVKEVLTGLYGAVISPDAGAEKRASALAKCLNVPLFHAWKVRSLVDGSITGFGHEPIPLPPGADKKLLIVDDICDGGGTFVGLGKLLHQEGYRLDLFVTHGIFSKGTQILTDYFERIFCTDSILPAEGNRVTVFNVCASLLE